MPHFNCAACGTGLYSSAAATELIDKGCPRCGAQAVAGGDQADAAPRAARLRAGRAAATRTLNTGHQEIVDRFAGFMARGRKAATGES